MVCLDVPAFQRLGQRSPDRPAGIVDQDADPADALDVRPARRSLPMSERSRCRHRCAAVAGDPSATASSSPTARDGNHDGAVQSELLGRGRTGMPDDAGSRMRLPVSNDGLHRGAG